MSLVDAFRTLEHDLNAVHLERPDVVHSGLLALLAQEHLLLLGPPGTGKSRLARHLAQAFQGTYFEWLLGLHTTPEELFGPYSLQALEADSYRRIPTGRLPEADVAFLDEIFKPSSALLNLLLAVLNERRFHNDGQAVPVPLQTCIGASNELPEDREQLAAIWDRFLFRHVVDYIQDPATFLQLLAMPETPPLPHPLDMFQLQDAQAAVAAVDPAPIFPVLATLRQTLLAEQIVVSDRRWHRSLKALQAEAWLHGRPAVAPEDGRILAHILWDTPDQRPVVRRLILQTVAPYDATLADWLDAVRDAVQEALQPPGSADADPPADDARTKTVLETIDLCKKTSVRIQALAETARKAQQPVPAARDALAQISAWIAQLSQQLGVGLETPV